MASLDDLRKKGWHLTQEGLQFCIDKLDGKTANLDNVLQVALNTDLKDIGDSVLPSTGRVESLPASGGYYVMQVQRVRNVSAPKDNEDSGAAPPLLKVTLTDGKVTIIGLDVDNRLGGLLSTRTPPGTKVALDCAKATFSEGYWLADAAACKHLGGRVSLLAESWRLRSDLRCGADGRGRRREAGGAPSFVPFGSAKAAPPGAAAVAAVANFKSMTTAVGVGNGESGGGADADEADDGGEFAEQRRAMIDEARQQQRKAFATASHNQQRPQAPKRQQQQQQQRREDGDEKIDERSVDTIMGMGYSFTEALAALRHTHGDLGKAVDHILASQTAASARLRDPDREDRGPIFAGADGSMAKPSAKLRLFDFVQGLPISGIEASQPQPQTSAEQRDQRWGGGGQRGPPSSNQRGDQQNRRGPPLNQRGEQDQRSQQQNLRHQRGNLNQSGPPFNQQVLQGNRDSPWPPPNQRNQGGEQDQRRPPNQRNRREEQDQRGPPNQRNQRGEQDQRGPPNQRNQRGEQDQSGPLPNQLNQRGEQDQRGPPSQRNQRGEQDQRGPPNQRSRFGEQDQDGQPNQHNQRGEQDQTGPLPNQRNQRGDQGGPPPNQRGEQSHRGPLPNQRVEPDQKAPAPGHREDQHQSGRQAVGQQSRGPPPPGLQSSQQPPPPQQSWCPRVNEVCLARFTDNRYYAAVIVKMQPPDRALISWCDYDQTQSVPLRDLMPAKFDQPPPLPPTNLPPPPLPLMPGPANFGGGGGQVREFYGRGARGFLG